MIFNLMLCLSIVLLYLLTRRGKKEKATKDKRFLIITFVALFIIVATREFTIGNDTSNYIRLYEQCREYKWDIFSLTNYYEHGYLAFNVILSYLNVTPRLFLVILSLIYNFAAYRFIKDNSKNYLMSTLMYVNMMYLYQSMTMMRQFFALAIVLLVGYKYVKEKKIFRFIATILFASMFHSTALLAILIYPLFHIKYSRKLVLAIIVGSIICALSLDQIYTNVATLLGRGAFYSDTVGEAKLSNFISMAIMASMYIFSLAAIKKGDKKKYSFYLSSLLFATAVYFVSINMAVLSRAAQYFEIFCIISLPNIIEENMKESRETIQNIIVGLLFIYASVIMINKPEWNTAYEYKTCMLPEEGYVCE